MQYHDKIHVSEGTNVGKTSESKECNTCRYWYFSNKGFKLQPNVCNRCHDSLMMSMFIAILNIKSADYCFIISGISKSEAININDLTEKKQNIMKHKNLLSHIKIWNEILTFGDIESEKQKFYRHKSPIF